MYPITEQALHALESGPQFRIDCEAWAAGQPGLRKLSDLVVNTGSLNADITRRVIWEGTFQVAAIDMQERNVFELLDPELGTWLEVYYVIVFGEGYEERIPFPAQVVIDIDQEAPGEEITIITNSPEIYIEDNSEGQFDAEQYYYEKYNAAVAAGDPDADITSYSGAFTVAQAIDHAFVASAPLNFPCGKYVDSSNTTIMENIATGYEYSSSPNSFGAYLDNLCLEIGSRWYVGRDNAIHIDPQPVSGGIPVVNFRSGINGTLVSKRRKKTRASIYNKVNVDSIVTGNTEANVDQKLIDAMGPRVLNKRVDGPLLAESKTGSELINKLTNLRIAKPVQSLTYPHLDPGDTNGLNDAEDSLSSTIMSLDIDLNGNPSAYVIQDLTPISGENDYTYS